MKKFVFALGIASFMFACGDNSTATKTTHRKGKTIMYADEAYQPLMETASYTYNGLYPNAEITFTYTSETDAMNAMAKGLSKTIFVSRDFTAEEKKNLHASNIQVVSKIIARDAITLFVNLESVDTLLTLDQLRSILTSDTPLGPLSKNPIEIVFDRVQSSNFNYLHRWLEGKEYGKMVHALKSTKEVIEYVKTHKNVIGVIGYNYIADMEDRNVTNLLKQIKVISVQAKDGLYWRPYKATLLDQKYPLIKEIWSINSGAPDGLNTGYINFLDSRQGQLLVDKCDLGPGKGTPREIQIISE